MSDQPEKHAFDVDTSKIMDTIIKSVYSTSDIFIRELISNSSDACDKFRRLYMTFRDKNLEVDNISSLNIQIIPDANSKTLTIKDNGIGMRKVDLINDIGSIASSGTRKFKEELEKSQGDKTQLGNLIGQFGLGFYSSFLVAEKVDIVTRHPEDEAYIWSSYGKDSYTIEKYEGESFNHGTSIILYLKEGMEEFLESKKIISLVKKHSQFVGIPIYTFEEKEVDDVKEEKAIEEIKDENKTDENKDKEENEEPVVEEPVVEEETKEVKKKKIIEKVKINNDKPLWDTGIKNASEEELGSLYKSISGDWDTYMAVQHYPIQGMINMNILLFIPKRMRLDMFNTQNKKTKNIHLYANNVFVTDDLGDAVPEWMEFVVGVVASNDIAMNVSRELIQGNNVMRLIKKTLPQKVIDMITKLSKDEEQYKKFYREFGNLLKFAIAESKDTQLEKLVNLLRYPTTKSEGKMKTFGDYVEGMKENQKQIYILTGVDKDKVDNSPFLEKFKDMDLEVILMYDATDEAMLKSLKKYRDFSVQRITSEGVELPKSDDTENADIEKEYEELLKKAKEILGKEVEKVIINTSLKSVPSVISTTKYSDSAALEFIKKAQLSARNIDSSFMMGGAKKVFELNPDHSIVKKLKKYFDEDSKDQFAENLKLLFYTVSLNCGFVMNNTSEYCKMIYNYMSSYDLE